MPMRAPFLISVALPLADARPACVGQHRAADLVEQLNQAVPLDGGADLLRARGDGERHLRLNRNMHIAHWKLR